jgi:hypothetical protein
LRFLPKDIAAAALREMATSRLGTTPTMHEWLLACFGSTLCERFFVPFHELYTAGLYKRIAPQDGYKSPVDLALTVQGAFGDAKSVGYNVSYLYPEGGLDGLTR